MTETKTEAPIGPQTHRPLPESMRTIERLLVTGEIVEMPPTAKLEGYGRYRWATPGELLDMCEMQCANQLDELKRLRAALQNVARRIEGSHLQSPTEGDTEFLEDIRKHVLIALRTED